MKKSLITEIKWLTLLLFVSFAGIYGQYQPVIHGFEKIAVYYDVVYYTCLAYLSSFIFYIIVQYIPKCRDYIMTRDYVENSCNQIYSVALSVIENSINKQIERVELRYSTLSKEDLKKMLKNINFDTYLSNRISTITGDKSTVVKSICDELEVMNNEINDLFRFMMYLDIELINLLNLFVKLNLHSIIKSSMELGSCRIDGIIIVPVKYDLSTYVDCIYEFYLYYKRLQIYNWKNHNYSLNIQVDIMMNTFCNEKNMKKTIDISNKILKREEKDTETNNNSLALLFRTKAAIEMNDFKKSVEYLNISIKKYPYHKEEYLRIYGEEKISKLLK